MFMAYVFHWKKSIWILWRHAKIVTSILNDTGVSCSFNIFRPGRSVLPSSLFCQRNIISIYWPPPPILTISYPPDPPPLPSPITQNLLITILYPRNLSSYKWSSDMWSSSKWSGRHLIQLPSDPVVIWSIDKKKLIWSIIQGINF